MTNIAVIITEHKDDTHKMAIAFIKATSDLTSNGSKQIKIGLIGEPNSGKSTFTRALTSQHKPKDNTPITRDEFDQFSYTSETGVTISSKDIRAEHIGHKYTPHCSKPQDKHIHIIEHPDANKGEEIKCDINLSISFMRDNVPIDVCDLEETLWERNKDKDGTINVSEECNAIFATTKRHVTIDFGKYTNSYNEFISQIEHLSIKLENA